MRLFIAMELDEGVKHALTRVQQTLADFDRAVRWVKPEQMHLTLVFLGDVADGRVASVCDAVHRAAEQAGPFDFALTGSGCFPPKGQVRVVWVGIEEPGGVLLRCQAAVADELASLGFPREARKYSPHLTLGRVRTDSTRGALRDAVAALESPPLQQHVGCVRVVQSRLVPSGAQYTTVAEYALSG